MTEVQLYEEKGFIHWQPFALWLLGHSIKSADAATSEASKREALASAFLATSTAERKEANSSRWEV